MKIDRVRLKVDSRTDTWMILKLMKIWKTNNIVAIINNIISSGFKSFIWGLTKILSSLNLSN